MVFLLFNGGCFGWRTQPVEEVTMPAIVEFPQAVREAFPDYSDLFSCQPQRQHFAEYLTGLLVARKKSEVGSTATQHAAHTDDASRQPAGSQQPGPQKAVQHAAVLASCAPVTGEAENCDSSRSNP